MENTIITARFTKNKLSSVMLLTGIGLIILGLFISIYEYNTGTYYIQFGPGYSHTYYYNDDSFIYFFTKFLFVEPFAIFPYFVYIGILACISSLFFKFQMSNCALTITDKNVIGKASFGKSVDLPLKQISAVALGVFKSLTVATSSGKVHFWLIDNRSEVYNILKDVIAKIQINSNSVSPSNAEELRKYKELLDSGVITQEEFDEKKKQLLGL